MDVSVKGGGGSWGGIFSGYRPSMAALRQPTFFPYIPLRFSLILLSPETMGFGVHEIYINVTIGVLWTLLD